LGFTLVEILLAVALLSIIMTVMYSAFHTMGRVMRRTEQTKDTYQGARLILSRMRQDLSCAYFSPERKNFIFRGEDLSGRSGDADELTFVTAGHVISGRDAAEGDLAEVSYYLDENNPGILVRREDVSPDEDERLKLGGTLDILGKDVVGLNLRYFDGAETSARPVGGSTSELDETLEEEDAWKDEWHSESEESDSADPPRAYLPRAVRIDLWLLTEKGRNQRFSRLSEEEDIQHFSTTVVLAMGRTATSIQPTAPAVVVGRPGARGPTTLQPTGRRGMPRRGGDGRRDGAPGRGRGEDRRERRGPPRSPGSASTPRTPGVPRIQRNAPNAGPGIRPPTPRSR